jgi:hypothetical protein
MSIVNGIDVNLSKQDIAEHIISILDGIRFGSLEIVVHDGRVVQIDKLEKFRIKNPDKLIYSQKSKSI